MPPPLKYQSALPPEAYVSKEILRDTLTQEQLQAEMDMLVNLQDPAHYKIAHEVLGPIPDTCKILDFKDHYIIRMTLEQAFKLHDLGVGLEDARGERFKKQEKTGGGSLQIRAKVRHGLIMKRRVLRLTAYRSIPSVG